MNLLDQIISWVSPAAGLARARHRLQLDQVRRYEGAAHGRRTDSWLTRSTSANAELQLALPKLRDRHRDLVRNNGWVLRAKQAVVAHTIGHGITSKLRANKTAQKRWNAWANSTACDADGRHNWYGLQALIWGTVFEAGECLIRRRWRRPEDGFAIPMQLQVLEPDRLDHSKTELLDSGRIVQGVQFNAWGQRIGYWLFPEHPGDLIGVAAASEFVAAADILHIFRQDRPEQVRGVPWGAANIVTVRDMDDCEDAFLFRQKIANCQVGVIYDENPQAPQGQNQPAMSEAFQPGRFDYLRPGQKIAFNTPPPASDINPMLRHYLLRIAMTYGITYAALTGDLTRVNFSSGRMGNIDMGRNITQWQWLTLAPQLLDPVVAWFGEALAMTGMAVRDLIADHGMPRREMIDPGKEIAAIVAAIRAGLTTLPAALRELGEDADELLDEYAATNAVLDKLGLKLDSDPRNGTAKASKSGARSKRRVTTRAKSRPAAAAKAA
ncbi:phage portal protein [Tahibacter harae]|uniref:Phage portal protein n=1 Tax=Tahibacter harae TaxID=2963937 RepID=A0ABT1QS83_9GAMM|nr:phage portal protein [Tahibacter harae]MCQ4165134.1 phage portal protein [Tahibacter harae]